ncbi:hypothetical protein SAMN04490179_4350 [Pseudomonas antarctica]|uniref:Uncharacterized protein n=1 Tax=Pseudomonas antarctica TaxID=219572 RepID=A0A1H0BKH0_9PSED|nr:hypothetical protein PSAN_46900 [Pseudomonas antarctica]SDN46127.1 hypothetical protein SAMN04490179_4350 [Pseudomonas antarctica]
MNLQSSVSRLTLLGALIIGAASCSNMKPSEDHLTCTFMCRRRCAA